MSKDDFWEGYVPEPVKPAQQALNKMAENARELGLDYEPAHQEPVWDASAPLVMTPHPAFQQPAQRTWVGLSDNEIALIHADYPHPQGFARAIEAKLKEKNT